MIKASDIKTQPNTNKMSMISNFILPGNWLVFIMSSGNIVQESPYCDKWTINHRFTLLVSGKEAREQGDHYGYRSEDCEYGNKQLVPEPIGA
jgi:hypothetical protein